MKTLQKYVKHTGAAVVFAFLLLTLLTGCEEKETAEMIEKQIKEFEASMPVEKKQLIKSVNLKELNVRTAAIYYSKYDSLVYIADPNGSRILIFDVDLNYKTEFGRYGQGPLEFREPAGILRLRNGKIIVTDLFTQKLKIFDKDLNLVYEKKFIGGSIDHFLVKSDSNDLIYLNLASSWNKHLFIVINDRGDTIKTFGDELIIPKDERKIRPENRVYFDIDENNDIYCAFVNNPLIRKYNNNFQLEYEIKTDTIPYVKKLYAEWIEERKGKTSSFTYRYYSWGMFVDKNYIYVTFPTSIHAEGYVHPKIAFDKVTGKIVKILNFEFDRHSPSLFDNNSGSFIFGINSTGYFISKYSK